MDALTRLRSLTGLAAGAMRALAVARGGRAHPPVSGRLRVGGIDEGVTVTRDRFGVPHVEAASDLGAAFGQGFVQGQDRLFQLELFRRAAAGRLAEVFGPRALDADRFARRIGLAGLAAGDVAAADADARGLLDAFAGGVNAAMATLPALPPEFAVTGAAPDPWRPEHSLLIGRLLLLGFAPNWDAELQRERLLAALGPERAALVDVAYPPDAATTTGQPADGAAERLLRAYAGLAEAGAPSGGGVERVGARGLAHAQRRAAARQRPARARGRAGPVPRRAHPGRRVRRDRRRRARRARRGDRT